MTDFKLWDFEIFIKMCIVIVRHCCALLNDSMQKFDSDVNVVKDVRKLEAANQSTSLFLLWYFTRGECNEQQSIAIKLIIGIN